MTTSEIKAIPNEMSGNVTLTTYGSVEVDGIKIAFREAGDPTSPELVLLHGWPSSSHQYRKLIPLLADGFHVVAPDYPGFGNSDTPDPASFLYTFDKFANVINRFLEMRGFEHFGVYMHDYGGPVGFRIFMQHPHKFDWLIIQNSNLYKVGLSESWSGLRDGLWVDRNETSEAIAAGFFDLNVVKAAYLSGAQRENLISPDNWNMDYLHTLQRFHGRELNLDLFYDYRNNVALYPQWQAFLRRQQTKTIIFWGQEDIFFTPAGGEAYLDDLPQAELHRLRAGHFAIEDHAEYIAEQMHRFHAEEVSTA